MCGAVAEWSKALAWKVSIRQNRIVGSNPTRSATVKSLILQHFLAFWDIRGRAPFSRAAGTGERRVRASKAAKRPEILPAQVAQYRFRQGPRRPFRLSVLEKRRMDLAMRQV